MKRFILCLFGVCTIFSVGVLQADQFKVSRIEVRGLQRLKTPAVLSHVHVRSGQIFDTKQSASLITDLYRTGFFSNVELKRLGNALIIRVQEKPTIGLIQVHGNKVIKSKLLNKSLKAAKFVAGSIFDSDQFNAYIQGLRQQYKIMGHYQAVVKTKVQLRSRNRVAIFINIHEGDVTKIKSVSFVGNDHFSSRSLLKVMHSRKTGLFSFLSHSDQYSEQKLDADMVSLSNFYFDHGFLLFKIISKQATMSADHRQIRVVIRVSEGPQFTISSVTLKGNTLGQHDNMMALLKPMQSGKLFSRRVVMSVVQSLNHFFSDRGYAFADIKPEPQLNVPARTVRVVFYVNPNHPVYVRRIIFSGNMTTHQAVLRSKVIQMEDSLYSRKRLQESARLLATTPYIQFVNSQIKRVSNTKDQVDVLYHVKEIQSGRAQINGGYSDTQGFIYGASISEPNFLGLGRTVGISFSRSHYTDQYAINYFNPFYRPNGLGRGFSGFYNHTTPGNVNITNYALNTYGLSVNYSFPVSARSTLSAGLGYVHNEVILQSESPLLVKYFVADHGSSFDQGKLSLGWRYSSLDRFLFPTKGFTHVVGGQFFFPFNKNSLTYYLTNYSTQAFFPLNHSHSLVLNFHSSLGYGNGIGSTGDLPFFKNFYAGGIDSVPGFVGNSLGPLDQYGNALGGNILTTAGFNLYFPNFISNNLRMGLTLDGGTVFQNNFVFSGQAGLRYSAGIVVRFKLPIFPTPISVGTAWPLNKHSGDNTSLFGFTMGGAF